MQIRSERNFVFAAVFVVIVAAVALVEDKEKLKYRRIVCLDLWAGGWSRFQRSSAEAWITCMYAWVCALHCGRVQYFYFTNWIKRIFGWSTWSLSHCVYMWMCMCLCLTHIDHYKLNGIIDLWRCTYTHSSIFPFLPVPFRPVLFVTELSKLQ